MKAERLTEKCCKACGGSESKAIYEAREMMFGLRTRFHYAECAACGSLWLTDPPRDFSPYYTQDYYSFEEPTQPKGLKNAFVARLRAERNRSYLSEGGWLGRFLARHYKNPALSSMSMLKVDRHNRVLDVGCGTGPLLLRVRDLGFEKLTGIDPFIPHDIRYANGVQIRKCFLGDLDGEKWDTVMFHHSLEHVSDPRATLLRVKEVLAEEGQCLIRLPVVAWAWEQYRASWIGLDPPRHLWVPTERGMRVLAESAGLRMRRVQYDSDGMQFWGSELYSRDHAYAEVGPRKPRLTAFFTKKQLAEFQKRAEELNQGSAGDSAAFLLESAA
jgi:SAM-dependent methyltransferase